MNDSAPLGFTPQKNLGNFIIGLYLLATRPFNVGIGPGECTVREVTINYTKVLIIDHNFVSSSNL